MTYTIKCEKEKCEKVCATMREMRKELEIGHFFNNEQLTIFMQVHQKEVIPEKVRFT